MTEDPQYNPAWPIYMALDFGWWTNFIGWVQPPGNGDPVIMLYGLYQAKHALAIHQGRGYGQLTGGWGDSPKPTALRAYSQVFGVEIQGDPGRVEKAQELVKHWLKRALLTKWPPGSASPGNARNGCFRRCGLQGARAGDGPSSFAGCSPVLLYKVGRSMTMSASKHR